MKGDISHFEHEGKNVDKNHDGTTMGSEIFEKVDKVCLLWYI